MITKYALIAVNERGISLEMSNVIGNAFMQMEEEYNVTLKNVREKEDEGAIDYSRTGMEDNTAWITLNTGETFDWTILPVAGTGLMVGKFALITVSGRTISLELFDDFDMAVSQMEKGYNEKLESAIENVGEMDECTAWIELETGETLDWQILPIVV